MDIQHQKNACKMKTLPTEFIHDGTPYRIIERTAMRYFAERMPPRGFGGNYETGRIVRDDDGNEQIVGDKEFAIDPFACETVMESTAYQSYLAGKQHDENDKFETEHARDMAMFAADDARMKNSINQLKANTMETKSINYKRASRLAKRIKDDRSPVRNTITGAFVYYYASGWFTVIDGTFAKVRNDSTMADTLTEYPDAAVTFVKIVNGKGIDQTKLNPPDVIANHKNLKTVMVADDAEFVELVSNDTGVEVTTDDLAVKPMLPGHVDKNAAKVNFKRVGGIINRLRGKDTSNAKPRIFCAGDYPVTAAQRSFGLKVRAMIQKIQGK